MLKKVLITGGGGYIGSRMVEMYLKRDYQITVLDRFFLGEVFEDLQGAKNLTIIKDDIRNVDKQILRNIDAVIDLASLSNDPTASLNPKATKDINFRGAKRMATLAKEMGVKKYIFASSCSVYGRGESLLNEESELNPVSEYASSKIQAEKALNKLADSNFCVTLLRNATVYGLSKRRMRFDLIVNLMSLHAWKNNKIMIMGGGKQWRPLVHVDDCIQAFTRVLEEPQIRTINKQIFNVGSNDQNYQVEQVALKFKKYFNGILIEDIPSDPEKRDYRIDFAKIKKELHYKPTKTIENGIEEIVAALEDGTITDDLRTNTLQYYQYLIDADNLLKKIKLNNKLL